MSLKALLTEKDLEMFPVLCYLPLNYFSLEFTIYCWTGLFLKLARFAAPAADIFEIDPNELYFCFVATPIYRD
jgi:hypothetical protein